MDQLVQVAGALLILAAFTALQRGRMSPTSRIYLTLNLLGSLVLTAVALAEFDLGFLLLEGVWAIVSLWSLVQVLRGRAPSTAQ
jgi:hypothetical protein